MHLKVVLPIERNGLICSGSEALTLETRGTYILKTSTIFARLTDSRQLIQKFMQ